MNPVLPVNHQIVASMPWLTAEPESLWEVTGTYSNGGTFTRCLATVVPDYVTGGGSPLFEVHVWGGNTVVPASRITHAVPLLIVLADHPRTAYYDCDQRVLDAAAER